MNVNVTLEDNTMIEQLRNILLLVQQNSGSCFSGIGIIVCEKNARLPVFPIRPVSCPTEEGDLIRVLTSISSLKSEFHDGFHLISSGWELMKISQYFSPPVIDDAKVDRTRFFGGRYLAALFGSALPGVKLAGIASNGFGLAIFQHGREVYYERTK